MAQAMKRVGMALSRQKTNRVVQAIQGPGQFVLWEVVR